MRVICREAGCSRECADARAEAAARDLIAQFLANPPTHMLRVSVHDEDIDDEEIERRIRSLCRALRRHGCREYVDAVHFFEARRHDHIAVIYDGDAADPEAHLRGLVDRVFVGLRVTRYALPREKEPPALARYLVQALKPEHKGDVELPPEGFDGKRLLRRSRGYSVKRKQERQQVYETPGDFPCRTVEIGDQQEMKGYTFDDVRLRADADSGTAVESGWNSSAAQRETPRQEHDESPFKTRLAVGEVSGAQSKHDEGIVERAEELENVSVNSQVPKDDDPVESVTILGRRPKPGYEWDWNLLASRYGNEIPQRERGYIENTALPKVVEEKPVASTSPSSATEVQSSFVVARKGLPISELWKPVRALFFRRADPRDGALGRMDILSLLNSYVLDGGVIALDEAFDALVETGFLREWTPGRFVVVR